MLFDVETYVFDTLNAVKRSNGKSRFELNAVCPFCDKGGHFYINTESGNYVCFKCDNKARGVRGLVKLLVEIEGISPQQARKVIFNKSIEFGRRKSTPVALTERLLALQSKYNQIDVESDNFLDIPLPDEYIPIWHPTRGWRMPVYLKERGITKQQAKNWELGFCSSGRYAKRIIIPISCPNGKAFVARDATGGALKPKYLNPVGMTKGDLVHGWQSLKNGPLVLVEGTTDVMNMVSYGYECLGILGKSLGVGQLTLLFTLPPNKPVVIMLDPEELTAPIKIASQLNFHFEDVKIAKLPPCYDPGNATRVVAYEAYKKAYKYTGNRVDMMKARMAESKSKFLK